MEQVLLIIPLLLLLATLKRGAFKPVLLICGPIFVVAIFWLRAPVGLFGDLSEISRHAVVGALISMLAGCWFSTRRVAFFLLGMPQVSISSRALDMGCGLFLVLALCGVVLRSFELWDYLSLREYSSLRSDLASGFYSPSTHSSVLLRLNVLLFLVVCIYKPKSRLLYIFSFSIALFSDLSLAGRGDTTLVLLIGALSALASSETVRASSLWKLALGGALIFLFLAVISLSRSGTSGQTLDEFLEVFVAYYLVGPLLATNGYGELTSSMAFPMQYSLGAFSRAFGYPLDRPDIGFGAGETNSLSAFAYLLAEGGILYVWASYFALGVFSASLEAVRKQSDSRLIVLKILIYVHLLLASRDLFNNWMAFWFLLVLAVLRVEARGGGNVD